MVCDAMTLGELFKAKRQDLGLSIKEVEGATSIRAAYIEAIEEGETEKLLTSVYMQGFMRQYAVFLGLDVESLEKEFEGSFFEEVKQEAPKEFVSGLGSIEMRQGTLTNSFWKGNNILWGVSFVGVFAAAFLLCKLLGIF